VVVVVIGAVAGVREVELRRAEKDSLGTEPIKPGLIHDRWFVPMKRLEVELVEAISLAALTAEAWLAVRAGRPGPVPVPGPGVGP